VAVHLHYNIAPWKLNLTTRWSWASFTSHFSPGK